MGGRFRLNHGSCRTTAILLRFVEQFDLPLQQLVSMATQPENVIAYSSWASALPPLLSPPRISLRNGCPDCA
jgi:hypothetical protein